ncbi:MAG: hypothetical protein IPM24_02450 [Bryobacterales bacterium]|nr:hypothetical protein [Bryobacterales bacterium]
MSEQILLRGKILGIEEFLLSPAGPGESASAGREDLLSARAQWIALLGEVLPRALLAELGLARILLGSSGGAQFLLVLPGEARTPAEDFLRAAAADASHLSNGIVSLVWAVTENLGDWSAVRKRLNEEMDRKRGAPLASGASFEPFDAAESAPAGDYFTPQFSTAIREASTVGWNPETPGRILPGTGKHVWRITTNVSADGITVARHAAPGDGDAAPATLGELASRAPGKPAWGVLRGDVDDFNVRLRRVQTIEEYVPLSVLYKHFFAGELEVLCSLPEFWRKVTVLYSGGDDFAVYGSWDALIALARELQRLFHRFTEENLKEYPGAEGKTITMALAVAESQDAPLAAVYEEAGRNLDIAKAADKDCIYVLGRVLEWKQLADAAELKDTVLRMLPNPSTARPVLLELRGIYGKVSATGFARAAEARIEKVWRFHRRLNLILGGDREKEFQKLRAHLAGEIAGRKTRKLKLRPSGLVALEWALMFTEV